MYRQDSTKTEPITMKFLKEFISIPTYDGDRLLRKSRWEKHLKKIKMGMFYSPDWDIAWLKGVQYRLNGNHSSKALAEAYKEGILPDNLHANIRTFECETKEDLALLWSQFDNSYSVRSQPEIIHAAIRIHDDLGHIAQTTATTMASGVSWAINKGVEKGITAEDKQKYVHSHKDFFIWANQFAATRIFKRGPIIAAMYKTWQLDAELATEFWSMVRDASHPDHKSPTRILNDFFRESIIRINGTKVTTKSLGFYTKSILAWNAWRGGYSTDLKFYEKAYVDPVTGKITELILPK